MTLYSFIKVYSEAATDKEITFFEQVADAFWAAVAEKKVSEYIGTFDASIAEVEKEYPSLKGKLKTPCVVMLFRASDKDKFNVAILKGVGNVAAWKAKFIEILNKKYIDRAIKGGTDRTDPSIKIGKHYYYLGELFDKHVHAGKDFYIFDSSGNNAKLIKKGEWVGKLFSYVAKTGKEQKPAIMFYPNNEKMGTRSYFCYYEGPEQFDEKVLRYNYASTIYWLPTPFGIPIPIYKGRTQGDSGDVNNDKEIETKEETDKREAEIDAETAENEKSKESVKKLKKFAGLAGAAYYALKATEATEKSKQMINGAIAAGCLYFAFSDINLDLGSLFNIGSTEGDKKKTQ